VVYINKMYKYALLFIFVGASRAFLRPLKNKVGVGVGAGIGLQMDISADYFTDTNLIHSYKSNIAPENYNTLVDNLINNKLSRVYINTNYRQVVSVDNVYDFMLYKHYHISNIEPVVVPHLVEKTAELHVPLFFVNFTPDTIVHFQQWFSEALNVLSFGLPIVVLLSFLSGIFQITGGGGNGPANFLGKQKNRLEFINPNVSLSDWAGSPEIVEECKEVISYLENKEIYEKIGAEMPKGILLEGPPGTGKTLLAKAIASETNSSFISTSGSEFVELFVGMGAARVREVFASARQNTPCIIFIDEIDAIGKQRGTGVPPGMGGGNDEREQTLNQLLYEMDGFRSNDDIVVMAATNRKDVLDHALLRPGRFDRILRVPLPDAFSREKILQRYLRDKRMDPAPDISAISDLTDGFSGAQLKNLVNEAAILSAKNNYTVIQEKFLLDAFEKSLVGIIKTNATVVATTRRRVAVHESGHALLVLQFPEYFDFKKASVQPTYHGAGGYTLFTEKSDIKEGGLYTKDILKKRLMITLGGKAAESIVYGNDFVSLGATEDLRQANQLAQQMVGKFGMGNALEVFYHPEDIQPSQYIQSQLDKEALDLVREAYREAKRILLEKNAQLMEFTELLDRETKVFSFAYTL